MQEPDLPPASGGNPSFSEVLIRWQKCLGRHDLPWQQTCDAYAVWLSEIMLQQTQVATVIPYFQRFLARFPDVGSLAAAPQQAVMELWSGLGYYSRARNLHRCAQLVVAEHGGAFPSDPDVLEQLPGIGRSTAAAIAVFAHGVRAAILDGNVMRVFARVFGVEGYPGSKPVKDGLWRLAQELLPHQDIEAYTQGLMDLGATICTRSRPKCASCPMAARCVAFNTGRTAELPARKPKKALPEKHVVMLVLMHRGKVMLQKRPQTGIWGGLLSLPELPVTGEWKAQESKAVPDSMLQAAARYGRVGEFRLLAPVAHGFTHFRLDIEPVHVELVQLASMAAQDEHVWWDLERIGQAPLPSPVKKLLLNLESEMKL